MKESVHRILLSAILTVLAVVTTNAQCYILGNDNNWDPSNASAVLPATSVDGVYEGEVMFTGLYFAVGTQLSATPDDWLTFNSHRFGPENADALLVYNKPLAMLEGRDASFQVPTEGMYHIRVDFNKKEITLLGTYPERLYVVGNDNQWNPEAPSLILQAEEGKDGIYSGTIDLTESTIFSISSNMGDWQTFNEGRYYSLKSPLKINRLNKLAKYTEDVNGDIQVPYNGIFKVTVDFTTMTIMAYDPNYVPKYPESLNVNIDTSYPRVLEESNEGIYSGWVNITKSTFTITDSKNPTVFFGAPADNFVVETELSVTLTREPNAFAINASDDNPLAAYITIDLRNNRLTIFGNDESYPTAYPKELYVLGSDQLWFTNAASDVIPATTTPGIYTGDITFTGDIADPSYGYFAIIQRLGMTWDWVNAKRFFPLEDGQKVAVNDPAIACTETWVDGSWLFNGDPGTYTITVNLTLEDPTLCITEKTPTGITAPNATATHAKKWYYDLNGRFLGNKEPQKGVFIEKGRKVIK